MPQARNKETHLKEESVHLFNEYPFLTANNSEVIDLLSFI